MMGRQMAGAGWQCQLQRLLGFLFSVKRRRRIQGKQAELAGDGTLHLGGAVKS